MIDNLVKFFENNAEVILVSSISVFIVTTILFPLVVITLPKNFFVRKQLSAKDSRSTIIFILKNVAGYFLIITGLLMLVLPGPGIVAIIVGIMLVNFPAKKRLKNYFLSKNALRKQLNWIREKANKEPFVFSPRS